MNLRIVRIADRGVPHKERLHLVATAATDMIQYMVLDTERQGMMIVARPKHTLWFASTPLNANDNIVIYTGPGAYSRASRTDGATDHFFYWNLAETIWAPPNTCAVLVAVSAWETSPLDETPESPKPLVNLGTLVGSPPNLKA